MIRVLGVVGLDDDEAEARLGTGKARELLAYLVARGGQPVCTGDVIRALWGESPPPTAATIVHGAVRRIRGSLGVDAVEHTEGGYRLVVPRADVDLWVIEDLLEAGEVIEARRRWREPAFGPYHERPWAQAVLHGAVQVVQTAPRLDDQRVRRRLSVARLVGRRRELAIIERSLRRSRLVTIVGLGGVGKTRLALEVLRQGVDEDLHVDLSAAVGPAARRVVAGLGQPSSGDVAADLQAAAAYIGRRPVVLLLDGCEHDIEGAAQVVELLLATCPELRVLATSRQPLGVPGEHLAPLLPFTDPGDPRGDAVELLLDRASDVGFDVTAEDRQRAAVICARSAGVPLAIELGVNELVVARAATARGLPAPTPEQAVRGLVAAAVDALSAPTAVAARRAALLVGGFTAELLGAVRMPGGSAMAIVQELVASGLVVAETSGTARRFRFLDRAREELQTRTTAADFSAVLDALLGQMTAVRPDLTQPPAVADLALAVPELGNVDGILERLRAAGRSRDALRLAVAAAHTWMEDGHWERGAGLLCETRVAATAATPLERAAAVRAEALVMGTFDRLRRILPELRSAAALAQTQGDLALEGHLRLQAANASGYAGEVREAQGHAARLREVATAIGTDYVQAGPASLDAAEHLLFGRHPKARDGFDAVAQQLGDIGAFSDAARMHRMASLASRSMGDVPGALERLRVAEQLATSGLARGTLATIRSDVADLCFQQRSPDAPEALQSALVTALAIGNVRAAAILRTRLGVLHRDAPTVAQGALDLWGADRHWCAAAIAQLLDLLPRGHELHALAPDVVRAMAESWGGLLDPDERALVDAVAARATGAPPAAWEDELPAMLRQLTAPTTARV